MRNPKPQKADARAGAVEAAAEQPPWLSDDERSAWLASAAIMITLPAALEARMQQEADLTFTEYMVLAVLSEHTDQTMQMSEIAAGISASLSRLSHIAGKLEKRGLLSRRRAPGPGRRTNAELTRYAIRSGLVD